MTTLLVVAFLVVPLLELAVVIQVGSLIGVWPTIALLLFESLLGGWIVRREGLRAWRALRAGIAAGRMPDRELADAALVLVGGTLLLTPGFLTDVVGFLLVLPFTRPIGRRLLARLAARRMRVAVLRHTGVPVPPPGWRRHRVVPGEVVDHRGGDRGR